MNEVLKKLVEYLKMGSSDGKTERQELRRELSMLLGLKYDERFSKSIGDVANLGDAVCVLDTPADRGFETNGRFGFHAR